MPTIQRAAVGAVATLTAVLAACTGAAPPTATASTPQGSAAALAGPEPAPAPDGVTAPSDVFGPGCTETDGRQGLPAAGEGSAEGMADDPVATAVANVPLLSTWTRSVAAVPGLADSLNAQQELTLYAPTDAAFEQARATMGAEAFDALLADPVRLDGLLSHHLVHKRYDAEQLVVAGKTTQLAGGDVTVGGTPDAPVLTSGGGTVATVVCGNVPTSNATVFVIDKVLLPAF